MYTRVQYCNTTQIRRALWHMGLWCVGQVFGIYRLPPALVTERPASCVRRCVVSAPRSLSARPPARPARLVVTYFYFTRTGGWSATLSMPTAVPPT